MSVEELVSPNLQPFYLPIDSVNEAGGLLHQAQGVLACIGEGGGAAGEHATADACWAVHTLLERVDAIVCMRNAATEETAR